MTCFPVSGPVFAGEFQFSGCVIRAAGRRRRSHSFFRQAEEGTAVGDVCRKAGISEATYYNWRKKYAGLTPLEMKRLRQLEEENGKLKKIVADLSLDKEMLQDALHRNVWSAPSLQVLFGSILTIDSLHKCIRPLASGPLLRPGHDEIRARRFH